jgi:UDP-N-acetylmuramate dehydrogenase
MTAFRNDVPLAARTTLGIGGRARWFAEPENAEEVAAAAVRAHEEALPLLLLGRGSNLLVSDRGWPGLVIGLARGTAIEWNGAEVTAHAGAPLDAVVGEAVRRGYGGMEELSGIPGSIGGAVIMNAGAFSQCVADTLREAVYCDMSDYRVVVAKKDALELGYRSSALQRMAAAVLSARFLLKQGDRSRLEAIRRDTLEKRRESQPLNLPNCGSVFKRPRCGFAGALIEQAGLKGFRYGNAQISSKHANFIVNLGGATAAEVRHLIVLAQKRVFEMTGILLEPEVIFAGEFEEELFKPCKK